ncbi:MAG TPA: dihydroorotase [Flavisolibacter sp.]|nr:dihydroorotase [Flavisolibacter sp.]
MEILLRQVKIIDPSSPFHQQTIDILIENGIIKEVGKIDSATARQISIEGLHVSQGWLDVFSNFCDPGFEYKETLQTGSDAAASGGYTDVMILPNTSPVVHNKAGIEYIVQRSKDFAVNIHPIAAVTKNTEGKELAEMYDMHQSGAVAFGDGTSPIQSSGLLLKALQYLKAIDKAVIQVPDDKSVNPSGLMNEGIISTQLGLPGKPAIGEELMIARDIELVKYTNSKIHFTGISTAKSVELIRQAKKEGLAVTCSVTPYHLCFTDDDLVQYDTNLKVNPPLRTKEDQQALKQGLVDGTVDCIATHHLPQDIDHKIVEFEYAHFGMIGLETSFAVIRTYFPELGLEKTIDLLSNRPRMIFDLPTQSIDKNSAACVTLFLPEEKWTVEELHSKSKNSPFIGKQLTGKPVGIINKDKVFLNQ